MRYCEALSREFCREVIFEMKQIVFCRSQYSPYSTKTQVTERTVSSPKEWVTAWFARRGTKKLQHKPSLCTNKITVALCSAEDQLSDTLISSPTKQDYPPTDRWLPLLMVKHSVSFSPGSRGGVTGNNDTLFLLNSKTVTTTETVTVRSGSDK